MLAKSIDFIHRVMPSIGYDLNSALSFDLLHWYSMRG